MIISPDGRSRSYVLRTLPVLSTALRTLVTPAAAAAAASSMMDDLTRVVYRSSAMSDGRSMLAREHLTPSM